MQSIRVQIPGKVYAKAHSENWLPSLAVFVLLSKSHTGKNYYFRHKEKTKMLKSLADHHKIGLTSFLKHIQILKEKGLLHFYCNEMRLVSKKQLFRMRGRLVFVPENINTLSDIKTFLNTIPILSNIVSQQKAIDRILRYTYISEKTKKAFGGLTSAGYRSLKKYIGRGGKMTINGSLQLSVLKMGELIDRKSKNIISKYKKFLREKGIIQVFNRTTKVFGYRISFNQFLDLKEHSIIEANTYFYKGFVYKCDPSTIQITYRTASFT